MKRTFESLIESLTSKFEIYFNKFRNAKAETAFSEMMVRVNGPLTNKCDRVLMAAKRQNFKGQNGIHF